MRVGGSFNPFMILPLYVCISHSYASNGQLCKHKGNNMNEVVITKVSTHKKRYRGKTVHMYTVASGVGSKRTSQTYHMTEQDAEAMKNRLKG